MRIDCREILLVRAQPVDAPEPQRHCRGVFPDADLTVAINSHPTGPSAEPVAAVVEMKRRNQQFGCLNIAQQIAYAFGVAVNKDVVRRILQQHYAGVPRGNGPSWLTALAHAKDSLWSLHLFRCESSLLRSCWVMIIIDVFTRRFVGIAVEHGDVDGPVVCRMFNHATAKQPLPKYLYTHHDPLFRFHRWLANLRVLEIQEIKAVPSAPRSHRFVERMIRTIREELWTKCCSGTSRTLNESSLVSRSITTNTAHTAESAVFRRQTSADLESNGHYR